MKIFLLKNLIWIIYFIYSIFSPHLPPPTSKGISVFWLLSKPSLDLVSVSYSTDWIPLFFFAHTCKSLQILSNLLCRNNGLQVPYTYMCPDNISNSVSI
uniref:Uncharacterized protein n=1 Tax=Sinocyclocheilus rhinocerous TaxID=307959 RepID=A0A673H4C7_9TELE